MVPPTLSDIGASPPCWVWISQASSHPEPRLQSLGGRGGRKRVPLPQGLPPRSGLSVLSEPDN